MAGCAEGAPRRSFPLSLSFFTSLRASASYTPFSTPQALFPSQATFSIDRAQSFGSDTRPLAPSQRVTSCFHLTVHFLVVFFACVSFISLCTFSALSTCLPFSITFGMPSSVSHSLDMRSRHLTINSYMLPFCRSMHCNLRLLGIPSLESIARCRRPTTEFRSCDVRYWRFLGACIDWIVSAVQRTWNLQSI